MGTWMAGSLGVGFAAGGVTPGQSWTWKICLTDIDQFLPRVLLLWDDLLHSLCRAAESVLGSSEDRMQQTHKNSVAVSLCSGARSPLCAATWMESSDKENVLAVHSFYFWLQVKNSPLRRIPLCCAGVWEILSILMALHLILVREVGGRISKFK